MTTVDNAQELGKAIKNGQDEITIEGSLKDQIIKIKATGKVAWVVALGVIGVAVVAIMTMPAAAPTGAGFIADGAIVASTASAAVAVLGLTTTIAAVSICLGAKNKRVLETLYNDYKIVEKTSRYIKISKKK